jgi:hypothetical protein
MELLELPKNRIICSVLQLINYIVKDNTGFLENACLVGLIPVVMNFAVPDRAKEVRMQASFFSSAALPSQHLDVANVHSMPRDPCIGEFFGA